MISCSRGSSILCTEVNIYLTQHKLDKTRQECSECLKKSNITLPPCQFSENGSVQDSLLNMLVKGRMYSRAEYSRQKSVLSATMETA